MLTADVLNPTAVLNDFDVIGSLEFIPGEDTTLVVRLTQPLRKDNLRFVAPLTTIFTFHLPLKDGTVLDKSGTATAQDYSIWSTVLTEDDTADLFSGNFTFDLDLLGDGTKITKGWVQNGLSMIVTGDCC